MARRVCTHHVHSVEFGIGSTVGEQRATATIDVMVAGSLSDHRASNQQTRQTYFTLCLPPSLTPHLRPSVALRLTEHCNAFLLNELPVARRADAIREMDAAREHMHWVSVRSPVPRSHKRKRSAVKSIIISKLLIGQLRADGREALGWQQLDPRRLRSLEKGMLNVFQTFGDHSPAVGALGVYNELKQLVHAAVDMQMLERKFQEAIDKLEPTGREELAAILAELKEQRDVPVQWIQPLRDDIQSQSASLHGIQSSLEALTVKIGALETALPPPAASKK